MSQHERYAEVEIGECLDAPCVHKVRVRLDLPSELGQPETWKDLHTLDAADIVALLKEHNLHSETQPHPMWSHLVEHAFSSYREAGKPKRRYNKTALRPDRVDLSEKARRERLSKLKALSKSDAKALVLDEIWREDAATSSTSAAAPTEPAASAAPAPNRRATGSARVFVGGRQTRRINSKNREKARTRRTSGPTDGLIIENVVSKVRMIGPPFIPDLCWSGLAARYAPMRFPAASMACQFPPCANSQYQTGEAGFTGAASEHAAIVSHHLFAYTYSKLQGSFVAPANQGCVNFTTSGDIGCRINLQRFASDNENTPGITVGYQPRLIDMVQFKLHTKDAAGQPTLKIQWAANISPSGRICVVGFRTVEQVKKQGKVLMSMLRSWAEEDNRLNPE